MVHFRLTGSKSSAGVSLSVTDCLSLDSPYGELRPVQGVPAFCTLTAWMAPTPAVPATPNSILQ